MRIKGGEEGVQTDRGGVEGSSPSGRLGCGAGGGGLQVLGKGQGAPAALQTEILINTGCLISRP